MPSTTLILNGDSTERILLIATLKDGNGMPITDAPISVTLVGLGLLSAAPGGTGRSMLFQTTDESGTIQFTWHAGTTAGESHIYASAARGDSLTIRQLANSTP